MDAKVLEAPKNLKRFRVLSKDRVYYVIYDVDEDKIEGAFYDERCMSPAGLWAWQDREVATVIREYVSASRCENREPVLR
jgi:hypothetical protein